MGIEMTRLTYYMHDGPRTFRFELAGNLTGSDVAKLAQAWHTASSTIAGKTLAVDLTFVGGVDRNGHELLEHWRQAGARFVANSPPSRTLVESITGQPYASPDHAVGPTFAPRVASVVALVMMRTVLFALVVAVTLLFPARASEADLKQETLDAWDQYLQQANARMLERAKGTFLWAAESPERLSRVRAGEVVVSPMSHAPEAVPSGLIHHRIGAFIPGARIDDVIAVVRDYDRYPKFYKTSVLESKTLTGKPKKIVSRW
jgi:ABC-type transporter Mla MlaB component